MNAGLIEKRIGNCTIQEAIAASYAHFARYYVPMVLKRKHFEKQAAVVRLLLREMGDSGGTRHRVLDAACGTGNVLGMLADGGDLDLSGADGSSEMLSCALQDESCEGIPFAHCRWMQLRKVFERQGQFDLVYFLGNSIAHLGSVDELRQVVSAVLHGLAPQGVIAFDFRAWKWDESVQHLIEPGREVGRPRDLGQFEAEDRTVSISDCCAYSDGRQYITYNVKTQDTRNPEAEQKIVFSYLPFLASDALNVLQEFGFHDPGILSAPSEYPYVIARGFKRRSFS